MLIFYIYKKNMKKLLLCLLVISNSSFSQTEYSFDYLLHYNYTNHIDSTKSEAIYYLTNSKDNSYLARITKMDSLNLNIKFLKHDRIFSDLVVSDKNFQMAEFIGVECKNVKPSTNPYKYKIKYYDYIKLETSDTLEKYEIICTRSEKFRKKIKIGKYVLKFNTTMPYHLPNLFFSTLYEEWNKERDLPNYFLSEISFINFENKLITSEKFIEFTKIDKKIKIITDECGDF